MAQVLRQLPPQAHPDLLVGTDTLDDAGVFRLDGETALVQTVDFFPPLVDDPRDFGRIAAANALSDVYAMGGEPLTCLNIVGFPDNKLDASVLADILRGGAEVVAESGAVIVGGHSVRDAEVKYGLAVTGRVRPDRIITNAGARPGDRLVLTKPIGSGVLTSAAKAGKIDSEQLREAIAVMTATNRVGRDAAVAVGVHGGTDVTGFGLVGHAFELAEASDVSVVIDAGAVPLLTRTLDLARRGVLTRAHKTTRAYLGKRLAIDPGVEGALAAALMDAQTSGGLLLSVPEKRTTDLLAELTRRNAICAAVIGSVEPAGAERVRLRG
ncbi:MAG: selenide, water dikinase SelD [Planctomycetota bacterium]|nr:MAG: selenide, water dikinase SelD [Planctomycetota bacterium]